jgi:hypothetical protein
MSDKVKQINGCQKCGNPETYCILGVDKKWKASKYYKQAVCEPCYKEEESNDE